MGVGFRALGNGFFGRSLPPSPSLLLPVSVAVTVSLNCLNCAKKSFCGVPVFSAPVLCWSSPCSVLPRKEGREREKQRQRKRKRQKNKRAYSWLDTLCFKTKSYPKRYTPAAVKGSPKKKKVDQLTPIYN